MAKPLVPDELWAIVEPLLPPHPPRPRGGRRPVDDRACFAGILFVLKTGIAWEDLPQEMNCGCGMTCWRRMAAWHGAGVFERLHEELLARLRAEGLLDTEHALADSGSVRAVFGGQKTGPNPTDRAKSGTKHHVLTDANGVPLATTVTGANRHDVTQLLPSVDAFPAIRGRVGRPVTKPKAVIADRGYDSEPHRRALRERHIDPVLAERGTNHGSGLGVLRWPVERTISWLHQARRLRVRYDKRADVHEAFVRLRCDVICWLQLQPFC